MYVLIRVTHHPFDIINQFTSSTKSSQWLSKELLSKLGVWPLTVKGFENPHFCLPWNHARRATIILTLSFGDFVSVIGCWLVLPYDSNSLYLDALIVLRILMTHADPYSYSTWMCRVTLIRFGSDRARTKPNIFTPSGIKKTFKVHWGRRSPIYLGYMVIIFDHLYHLISYHICSKKNHKIIF